MTKIMHTAFANSLAQFNVLAHLLREGSDSRSNTILAVGRRLALKDKAPEDDVLRVVSIAINIAIDIGYIDQASGYRLRITDAGRAMAEKFFALVVDDGRR
jgi:hypothetical protein